MEGIKKKNTNRIGSWKTTLSIQLQTLNGKWSQVVQHLIRFKHFISSPFSNQFGQFEYGAKEELLFF